MAGFSMICCVVNMGDASKVIKLSKKYNVKGATISIGRGTANNRILDFFAINESRKEIVNMVAEKTIAAEAIKGISANMKFEKPNHGIAFSHSVSMFAGGFNEAGGEEENSGGTEGEGCMYKVIYVVVDKGKAEDVIDAANKAGARGGTIINARGAGIQEVRKFFSMEIEPEKEKVFIITKSETKDAIVASIRQALNIDAPGAGVMFVLNAYEAYGLY